MLLLDKVGKTMEVVLAAAVTTSQLPITVAYVEISQSNFAMLAAAANELTTNGVTAVTALGAPVVSVTRQLKHLSIVNVDTVAATVTIRLNTSGVLFTWFKGVLAVGDQILYSDDILQVLDSTGRLKSGFSPVPMTVADGANVVEGATTDLGVTWEQSATINSHLRGLVNLMQKLNDTLSDIQSEARLQTLVLQQGLNLHEDVENIRRDKHLLN